MPRNAKVSHHSGFAIPLVYKYKYLSKGGEESVATDEAGNHPDAECGGRPAAAVLREEAPAMEAMEREACWKMGAWVSRTRPSLHARSRAPSALGKILMVVTMMLASSLLRPCSAQAPSIVTTEAQFRNQYVQESVSVMLVNNDITLFSTSAMTRTSSIEVKCAPSATKCSLDGVLKMAVTGTNAVLKLSGGIKLTSKSHNKSVMTKSTLTAGSGSVVMDDVKINKFAVSTQTAFALAARTITMQDVDISECITEFAGHFLEFSGLDVSASLERVRFAFVESFYSLISAKSKLDSANVGSFSLTDVTCMGCKTGSRSLISITNFDSVSLSTVSLEDSVATKENHFDVIFSTSGVSKREVVIDGLTLHDSTSELLIFKAKGLSSADVKNVHLSDADNGGVMMFDTANLDAKMHNVTLSQGESRYKSSLLFQLSDGKTSTIDLRDITATSWVSQFSVVSVVSQPRIGENTIAKVTSSSTTISKSESKLESFINLLNADADISGVDVSLSQSAGPVLAVSNAGRMNATNLSFNVVDVGLGSIVLAKNCKDVDITSTSMKVVNSPKGSGIKIQGSYSVATDALVKDVAVDTYSFNGNAISCEYTSKQELKNIELKNGNTVQETILVEPLGDTTTTPLTNLTFTSASSSSSGLLSTVRTSPTLSDITVIGGTSQKSALAFSDSNAISIDGLVARAATVKKGNFIQALSTDDRFSIARMQLQLLSASQSLIESDATTFIFEESSIMASNSTSGSLVSAHTNLRNVNVTDSTFVQSNAASDMLLAACTTSSTLASTSTLHNLTFFGGSSVGGSAVHVRDANVVDVHHLIVNSLTSKSGGLVLDLSPSSGTGHQDVTIRDMNMNKIVTKDLCSSADCGTIVSVSDAKTFTATGAQFNEIEASNTIMEIGCSVPDAVSLSTMSFSKSTAGRSMVSVSKARTFDVEAVTVTSLTSGADVFRISEIGDTTTIRNVNANTVKATSGKFLHVDKAKDDVVVSGIVVNDFDGGNGGLFHVTRKDVEKVNVALGPISASTVSCSGSSAIDIRAESVQMHNMSLAGVSAAQSIAIVQGALDVQSVGVVNSACMHVFSTSLTPSVSVTVLGLSNVTSSGNGLSFIADTGESRSITLNNLTTSEFSSGGIAVSAIARDEVSVAHLFLMNSTSELDGVRLDSAATTVNNAVVLNHTSTKSSVFYARQSTSVDVNKIVFNGAHAKTSVMAIDELKSGERTVSVHEALFMKSTSDTASQLRIIGSADDTTITVKKLAIDQGMSATGLVVSGAKKLATEEVSMTTNVVSDTAAALTNVANRDFDAVNWSISDGVVENTVMLLSFVPQHVVDSSLAPINITNLKIKDTIAQNGYVVDMANAPNVLLSNIDLQNTISKMDAIYIDSAGSNTIEANTIQMQVVANDGGALTLASDTDTNATKSISLRDVHVYKSVPSGTSGTVYVSNYESLLVDGMHIDGTASQRNILTASAASDSTATTTLQNITMKDASSLSGSYIDVYNSGNLQVSTLRIRDGDAKSGIVILDPKQDVALRDINVTSVVLSSGSMLFTRGGHQVNITDSIFQSVTINSASVISTSKADSLTMLGTEIKNAQVTTSDVITTDSDMVVFRNNTFSNNTSSKRSLITLQPQNIRNSSTLESEFNAFTGNQVKTAAVYASKITSSSFTHDTFSSNSGSDYLISLSGDDAEFATVSFLNNTMVTDMVQAFVTTNLTMLGVMAQNNSVGRHMLVSSVSELGTSRIHKLTGMSNTATESLVKLVGSDTVANMTELVLTNNSAEHLVGMIGPRTTIDKVAMSGNTVTDALLQMANNDMHVRTGFFQSNNASMSDGAGLAKVLSGSLSASMVEVSNSTGASMVELMGGSSFDSENTIFMDNTADAIIDAGPQTNTDVYGGQFVHNHGTAIKVRAGNVTTRITKFSGVDEKSRFLYALESTVNMSAPFFMWEKASSVVYINGGKTTMNLATFQTEGASEQIAGRGAGVVFAGGEVNFTECKWNTPASLIVAALQVDGGTVNFKDVTFIGQPDIRNEEVTGPVVTEEALLQNASVPYDAAVTVTGGVVDLRGVTIWNAANGALSVRGGFVSLGSESKVLGGYDFGLKTEFAYSVGASNAGGITVRGDAVLSVENVTVISENHPGSGSARTSSIFLESGSALFANMTVRSDIVEKDETKAATMRVDSGFMTLIDSTITSNSAPHTMEVAGGRVNVTSTTFASNGKVAAAAFAPPAANTLEETRGAVFDIHGGTVFIVDSEILGNTNAACPVIAAHNSSKLQSTGTSIHDNLCYGQILVTSGTDVAMQHVNIERNRGGAIVAGTNSSFVLLDSNLTDSTFLGVSSTVSSALTAAVTAAGASVVSDLRSALLLLGGASVSSMRSTFARNGASAMHVLGGSQLVIDSCDLSTNIAASASAAAMPGLTMAVSKQPVSVAGAAPLPTGSGGIVVDGKDAIANAKNVSFTGNVGVNGGAVLVTNGYAALVHSRFESNRAMTRGGAVAVMRNGTATLQDSYVTEDNTAGVTGYHLFAEYSYNIVVERCLFVGYDSMRFTTFDTYGMAYDSSDFARFTGTPVDRSISQGQYAYSVLSISPTSVPKFESVALGSDIGLLPPLASDVVNPDAMATGSLSPFVAPPVNYTTTAIFLANVTSVRQRELLDYIGTKSTPATAFFRDGFQTAVPVSGANATRISPTENTTVIPLADVTVARPFYIQGDVVSGLYVNVSFVRPAEPLGVVALPPLDYDDLNTMYTGVNYNTTEYGQFIRESIYRQLGNTVMTSKQVEREEIVIQMVVRLRFGLPIVMTALTAQQGLWTKEYIQSLFDVPVEKIKISLPNSNRRTLVQAPGTAPGTENGTVVLDLDSDINKQARVATLLVKEHGVTKTSIRGSVGVIVGRGPGSNLDVDREQVADISSNAAVDIIRNIAMINMTDPRARSLSNDEGSSGGTTFEQADVPVRYRTAKVMSAISLEYMFEKEWILASIVASLSMFITGVALWGCCFQMPKAKVSKKQINETMDLFGDFGADGDGDGDADFGGDGFSFFGSAMADSTPENEYFGNNLMEDDDGFTNPLAMQLAAENGGEYANGKLEL